MNRTNKFSLNANEKGKCATTTHWYIAMLIILTIGLSSLIVSVVLYHTRGSLPEKYGLVIDAGSSHTSFYLYTWTEYVQSTGLVKQALPECEANGSLSSYVNDPESSGQYLLPCFDQLLSMLAPEKCAQIETYFVATGGMRILELVEPSASDRIMRSVQRTLDKMPFQTKRVSVITGEEEALFAWMSINYITGRLLSESASQRSKTIGAFDMGGASMEITFEVDNAADSPSVKTLKIFGKTYHLYAHSYLCCGYDQMERAHIAHLIRNNVAAQVISDPCYSHGYSANISSKDIFTGPCVHHTVQEMSNEYTFIGAFDAVECKKRLQNILRLKSECNIVDSHVPAKSEEFYATSGFYYVAKFFNCTDEECTMERFEQNINQQCGRSNEETLSPLSISHLRFYCIRGIITITLFTDIYGFSRENATKVKFVKDIDSTEVGWTLGFMLNTTSSGPEEEDQNTLINSVQFSCIAAIACTLIIISTVFFSVAVARKIRHHHSRSNR